MIIPYLFPYQLWCSPLGAPSSPEFSQDFAAPSALAVLEAGGPRGTQGDPGGPRGTQCIDVVHVVEPWVEELG